MNLSEISADRAIRRIDMGPLKRRFTQNLEMLVKLVEAYGFKIRVIGGAVRDVLLGLEPRDIDLVTDALPDAIMWILNNHDVAYTTRGIPHGTVKVKFSDTEDYEITSIAYTVEDECCPHRITIHSSESWEEDAKRRDFSVDTMSLDFDGHLYDYTKGMQDLRNQFVRFIGDAATRIAKEPILIMRFFKLLSLFKDPKFDKSILPLIKDNMKRLRKIKPERMDLEVPKCRPGFKNDG
jgi:tRNA nucleotidyltransferase/poly(A) polymerase